MTQWQETPFADILVDSKDGEWGQGEETVGHQLAKVIRGTDFADLNNPTKELPRRWIKDHIVERKKLQAGDVLLETAGGTATQSTGRSAIIRKAFFENHGEHPVLCSSFTRYLRLDGNNYCPEFIFYLLQALYKAGYIAVYNVQHTGVSRFQYTTFKNKTVLKLPTHKTQKKIAALLSAYDDLIENNKCRIALLEKMAEEIYREWFVRMRFPGHEKAKFEKGVPTAWTISRVDSLGKVVTGKTPSTSVARYYGGPFLFVKTPDMHGNMFIIETEEKLTEDGIRSQPSQTIPKNSISVSCIGTGGIVSITTSHCQTNQQINTVVLKSESDLEWAFFTIKNLKETIQLFGATGTTMTNLSKGKFSALKILVPNIELRSAFNDTTSSLFSQIQTLLRSTRHLVISRNLLLGRLISGKLSVESHNIQFPPSMLDEVGGKSVPVSAKENSDAKPHHGRRHRAGNTKEAKA
jgi:type I restriction enzyme, S subunit